MGQESKGCYVDMPFKTIKFIKLAEYLDALMLEKQAKKILTDSGGVQKEAYILKVPYITMRESTEWIETIQDGWNILVGSDKEKIKNAIETFEPSEKTHKQRFGDGKSAEKIVQVLQRGEYVKGV